MSDIELQLALAKMLPVLEIRQDYLVPDGDSMEKHSVVYWATPTDKHHQRPRDTEWLHVCWLVEQDLSTHDWLVFRSSIVNLPGRDITASWQQRAVALCKIKGIK